MPFDNNGKWNDSGYTWTWKQKQQARTMSPQEIADRKDANLIDSMPAPSSPVSPSIDTTSDATSDMLTPNGQQPSLWHTLTNPDPGEFAARFPTFTNVMNTVTSPIKNFFTNTTPGQFVTKVGQTGGDVLTGTDWGAQQGTTTGNPALDQTATYLGDVAGLVANPSGILENAGIGNAINRTLTDSPKAQQWINALGQIGKNPNEIGNLGNAFTIGNDLGSNIGKLGAGALVAEMLKGDVSGDKSTLPSEFGSNWRAGTGQMVENAGQIGQWLGADQTGKALEQYGQNMSNGYTSNLDHPFQWSDMLDPRWYTTSVAQSLPSTTALMIPGMGAEAAIAGLGAKFGLGEFGRHVLGSIGSGTLVGAPLESAMEAGQTYSQGLQQGMTADRAKSAANQDFLKNYGLLAGTDSLENLATFAPTPVKGLFGNIARKMGNTANAATRIGADALLEGGQEAAQQAFQDQALGNPVQWDSNMKEQFAAGALMGGLFGVAGHLMNHADTIKNNTINRLPDSLKNEYDAVKSQAQEAGLSEEEATQQALDHVAATPEGQNIVHQVTQEVAQNMNEEQLATQPANATQETVKQPVDFNVGDLVTPTNSSGELLTEEPVKVTDVQDNNGQKFYQVEGSNTYFPASQITQPQQDIQKPVQPPVQPQMQQPIQEAVQQSVQQSASPLQEQHKALSQQALELEDAINQGIKPKENQSKLNVVLGQMKAIEKQMKQQNPSPIQPPKVKPQKQPQIQVNVGDKVKLKNSSKQYEVIGVEKNGQIRLRSEQGTELPPVYSQAIAQKVNQQGTQELTTASMMPQESVSPTENTNTLPVQNESSQPATASLPSELKGAKPRYSYRDKQFQLHFASDTDKAFYIVRKFHADPSKMSKRDKDYMDFLKTQFPNMKDHEIRHEGERIAEYIKGLAKGAEPGKLNVPEGARAQKEEINSPVKTEQSQQQSKPEFTTTQQEPVEPTQQEPSNVLSDQSKTKFDAAREKLDWSSKMADMARKRIDSRKNNLNSLPMNDLVDYAIIGMDKMLHGVVDFAEWSDHMMKEFGGNEKLKRYLRAIHAQSEDMKQLMEDGKEDEIFAMIEDTQGKDIADSVRQEMEGQPSDQQQSEQPSQTEQPKEQPKSEVLTKDQLQPILDDVVSQAKTAYGDQIEKIVLYGSYAKGNAKSSSDVDILILTTKNLNTVSNRFKLADMMESLSAKYGKEVHLVTEALEYYNDQSEEWLQGVKDYAVELYSKSEEQPKAEEPKKQEDKKSFDFNNLSDVQLGKLRSLGYNRAKNEWEFVSNLKSDTREITFLDGSKITIPEQFDSSVQFLKAFYHWNKEQMNQLDEEVKRIEAKHAEQPTNELTTEQQAQKLLEDLGAGKNKTEGEQPNVEDTTKRNRPGDQTVLDQEQSVNGSANEEVGNTGPGSVQNSTTSGSGNRKGGKGSSTEESTNATNEQPGQVATHVSNHDNSQGASHERLPQREATKRGTRTTGTDFVITNELDDLGGAKTKFKNNVAALRLLRALESIGRLADPQEQAVLAKYVGWGGLAQAFKESDKNWNNEIAELKSLVDEGVITKEQYDSMKKTTQYAHFTPKPVIQAMYQSLENFGFKGGRVLEPGVGSGNFFGLMPEEMSKLSTRIGVEMDPLTANIAKQLYQNATIHNKPFQDYVIADNWFDAAVGNPPFSDNTLTYKTEGKKKLKPELHNYFFLKSLDKIRPGGIVAFVTSSGTMNAQGQQWRKLMSEKANFLGAIRLPGEAFKKNAGTEVTTDIIFLQKREEGTPANHQADFIDTQKIDISGKEAANNEYFVAHPEMVLGDYTTDKYGRAAVEANGRDLAQSLQDAINHLPKDIYQEPQTRMEEQPIEYVNVGSFDINALDNLGYGIKEDKIVQRVGDTLVAYEAPNKTAEKRVRGMIAIRDAAKHVMQIQRNGASDEELKAAQQELERLYDKFVVGSKYGPLNNDANKNAFKADMVGASLLRSLEDIKEGTKNNRTVLLEAKKSSIFNERTIQVAPIVTHVETANDAMVASFFQKGHIDLNYMKEISGKDEGQLIAELSDTVFRDPTGGWQIADEYLSGNVRQKLREAKEAAKTDSSFTRNVQALESVQPTDLTPDQIQVQLGTPWIPEQDVENFINAFLEVENEDEHIKVTHVPLLAQWDVDDSKLGSNFKNSDEFGVKGVNNSFLTATEIIQELLHQRQPVVQFWDEESKRNITDQNATANAVNIAKRIQDAFSEWLWSDQARMERLTNLYNEEFNAVVLRKYDGELVYGNDENNKSIPGLNTFYKLRQWQKNGVWRIVQGLNTLLAHVVGAGKTLTMIAGGMELKRLGLIRKPMYVVPNSLLDQWEGDFRKAYPDAKILKISADTIPSVAVQKRQLREEIGRGHVFTVGQSVKVKDQGAKKWLIKDVQGNHLAVENKNHVIHIHKSQAESLYRPMTDKEFEDYRNENRIARATALNKIAVGNYDAILITHKTFEKLPISPGYLHDFIREQIVDLEVALQAIQEEGDENDRSTQRTVKQLENMKEDLENKLTENLDEESKDVAVPFELLGIDQLFVDEAHMFKNLRFFTRLQGIAGLPNTSSKRAEDMYMKTQWLTKSRGGKGVVFATGTPVSNTLAEMYTMQKYLQMSELRNKELAHFDAWAGLFARSKKDIEMDATGGYKEKSRFIKFVNVPELMRMFMQVADIQNANMLDLPKPKVVNRKTITAPMSLAQRFFQTILMNRADAMDPKTPEVDNWLKLTGDGRRSALDLRIVRKEIQEWIKMHVEPSKANRIFGIMMANNPKSKINLAIDNIYHIYKEGTATRPDKNGEPLDKLAQLVFLDLSTPKAAKEETPPVQTDVEDGQPDVDYDENAEDTTTDVEDFSSVYQDIKDKLVAKGVPASEISFIHDAKNDKQRKSLFEKVKRGEVRLLLGSTEKMGAGMNVQDRLVALHHLDAPWRPSDVEQREGRIIRQGNRLDEVTIYTYATEGSFDALMWDILTKKAGFVAQAMSGDLSARELEDVGDFVANFAYVQAAATGDDTVIRRNEALMRVREFESEYYGFQTQRTKQKGEIVWIPKRVTTLKTELKGYRQDEKTRQDVKGDKFSAVINGVAYTKRAEAGKALIDQWNEVGSTWDPDQVKSPKKIGSFAGFDLYMRPMYNWQNEPFYLKGEAQNYYFELSDDKKNVQGQAMMMQNSLNSIERKIQEREQAIESLTKNLAKLKELVKVPYPADKLKSLEDWRNRLADLDRRMLEMDANARKVTLEQLLEQYDKGNLNPSLAELRQSAENKISGEGQSMGVAKLFKKPQSKVIVHPKSEYAFEDPEIEQRWQDATIKKETLWSKFQERMAEFKRRITREFEHLPHTGEFSRLRFDLLKLQKQKDVAGDDVVKFLKNITMHMDKKTYDLFTRKVVLDDLMEEDQQGHALAFGFDSRSLRQEWNHINDLVKDNQFIQNALELRKQTWDAIKQEYIKSMDDIGFNVRNRVAKENYFRHQVIEKAEEKIKGTGKKLKTPTGRGFLKQRQGSTLDFNRDYLQAESEVMISMLYDVQVANVIKMVDAKYNIIDRVKLSAKDHNERVLKHIIAREQANPDVEKDAKVRTPTQVALSNYNSKIAWGFSELEKLKENGNLWVGENGEWRTIINSIGKNQDQDIETNSGGLFNYLAVLANREQHPGVNAARTILKNVANKKKFMQFTLGKNYKTWEDMIPAGYTPWQPREGNLFYMQSPLEAANTMFVDTLRELGVPDDLIQEKMNELKDSDGKPILALGGKRTQFVVKEEVSLTLDNLTEAMNDGWVAQANKWFMQRMKQNMLVGPTRVLKYNLRNMSGDLDKTLAGNPSAIKKVPQAIKELLPVFQQKGAMTPTMRDWFERGGMQTLLQVQEMGDINQLKMFLHLKESKMTANPIKVGRNMWEHYWKFARISTDLREAVLRYANYLDYLDQIEKNVDTKKSMKPNNFGASIPEEIAGLDDKKDMAFKLSNELLIAYDATSHIGKELRQSYLPFWSYIEGNMKSYVRLFKNAAHDDRLAQAVGFKLLGTAAVRTPYYAYRMGSLAVKISALTLLLALWNALHPDEEKDLPKDVRDHLHIILGRDSNGKVRYFSQLGSIEDFLTWFGMDTPLQDYKDMMNGTRTFTDVVKDNLKKPINKFVNAFNPFAMFLSEIATGKSLYPDVFKPRNVTDKLDSFMQLMGVQKEFDRIRSLYFDGKPTAPYDFRDLLDYGSDPGQAAYYDIKDLKTKFLAKLGKGDAGSVSSTAKTEALYNFKLALRYGDKEAQLKYLKEYALLGGKVIGINASLASLDPLHGMTTPEKAQFIKSLAPDDQERLKEAETFFRTTLMGKKAGK